MDRHQPSSRTHDRNRHSRGVAMITVLVALTALFAVSALAIDVGMIWTARTQVQNAADASALAAGRNLVEHSPPTVTLPESLTAAVGQAGMNRAPSTNSVNVATEDVVFGNWNTGTRTLDTSVDLTDYTQVTGVQVAARLDGANNSEVPAFFSRIVGRDAFTVSASATAYLGYAGSLSPGEVELPIAIDCCKLKGSDCQQPYCASSTPQNACDLVEGQDTGDNTVSCLEFHSTPEQNACWTEFDGESPSINTPGMTDIIRAGNPFEVDTSSRFYLDNGTKVPVIGDIKDAFESRGSDIYEPIHSPEIADSWVVSLPVVECQSADHCAGGSPARMVGVVCFEMREITVTPDKIIRGRFLCPDDDLFEDECGGFGTTGGLDFGIRADIPVLVR